MKLLCFAKKSSYKRRFVSIRSRLAVAEKSAQVMLLPLATLRIIQGPWATIMIMLQNSHFLQTKQSLKIFVFSSYSVQCVSSTVLISSNTAFGLDDRTKNVRLLHIQAPNYFDHLHLRSREYLAESDINRFENYFLYNSRFLSRSCPDRIYICQAKAACFLE